MPEHVWGRPRAMQVVEKAMQDWGFELVFDGSKPREGDINWLDKPTFYTKVYRWRLDRKWVNTWIRFVFDDRRGLTDMNISYEDLARIEQSLAEAKRVPLVAPEVPEQQALTEKRIVQP